MPGNLRGMAIHVSARVLALARPDETLVSSTVREMVTARDIAFEDRGSHELKGISGSRQLYAARVLNPGEIA